MPENGCLQYLDICICMNRENICWRYNSRSKKEILSYDSAHSKIIKRGIAKNCLRLAVDRSCEHQIDTCVTTQVKRLKSAGFPQETIASVAESLVAEIKGARHNAVGDDPPERVRPAVVPYIHQLSNRLKKVAGKCGVPVVFSAPHKLAKTCHKVNNETKRPECLKKHATRFVSCNTGVVYRIPLDCRKCYIGQTGRCLNDRLREHRSAVLAVMGGGHLADHCRRRKCTPEFEKTGPAQGTLPT